MDSHSILFFMLGLAAGLIGLLDAPVIAAIGAIITVVATVAAIYVFYEDSALGNCDPLLYLYAGLAAAFAAIGLLSGGAGFVVAMALYGFIGMEAIKAVSTSAACQQNPVPPTSS